MDLAREGALPRDDEDDDEPDDEDDLPLRELLLDILEYQLFWDRDLAITRS